MRTKDRRNRTTTFAPRVESLESKTLLATTVTMFLNGVTPTGKSMIGEKMNALVIAGDDQDPDADIPMIQSMVWTFGSGGAINPTTNNMSPSAPRDPQPFPPNFSSLGEGTPWEKTFSWFNDATQGSRSVSVQVTLSDGSIWLRSKTYTVAAPTMGLFSAIAYPWVFNIRSNIANWEFGDPDPQLIGIQFSCNVTTDHDFPGNFAVLQKSQTGYDAAEVRTKIPSEQPPLDGPFYMASVGPDANLIDAVGDKQDSWKVGGADQSVPMNTQTALWTTGFLPYDHPRFSNAIQTAEGGAILSKLMYNLHFTDYLMYRMNSDSMWVAIGKLDWSVDGTATYNGSTVWPQSGIDQADKTKWTVVSNHPDGFTVHSTTQSNEMVRWDESLGRYFNRTHTGTLNISFAEAATRRIPVARQRHADVPLVLIDPLGIGNLGRKKATVGSA